MIEVFTFVGQNSTVDTNGQYLTLVHSMWRAHNLHVLMFISFTADFKLMDGYISTVHDT